MHEENKEKMAKKKKLTTLVPFLQITGYCQASCSESLLFFPT
jgi:hypothetical protein